MGNLSGLLLADESISGVGKMLEGFLNDWWGPLLGVLAAAGVILGIYAGIRIWSASASGDENKLKSAKAFVIYIFIGYAIIVVLAAVIPVLVAALKNWYYAQ